ncbi:MAG: RDD family protein, partial [Bacteroidales bacterium]|nr:RDD family protein [Bacteroidales bacterium]
MTKRIDITTTQNVVIDCKAATVFERMLAWLIDAVIIVLSQLVLYLIVLIIFPAGAENAAGLIILTPIAMCYHLISEMVFNGVSLGKKAMGLRVVKINNEPVSFYDYFMRWAFRLIDIIASLGIISIITITSSPRNQRIGDYLADTTVIKINGQDRLSLSRIQDLDALKSYVPVYPEVVALSEKDMLVIKETLNRVSNST